MRDHNHSLRHRNGATHNSVEKSNSSSRSGNDAHIMPDVFHRDTIIKVFDESSNAVPKETENRKKSSRSFQQPTKKRSQHGSVRRSRQSSISSSLKKSTVPLKSPKTKKWKEKMQCWLSSHIFSSFSRFSSFSSPTEENETSVTEEEAKLAGQISQIPLPSLLQRGIFDFISSLQSLSCTWGRLKIVCLVLVLLCFSSWCLLEKSERLRAVATVFSNVFVALDTEETDRPGLHFYERFNNGSSHLPHRRPVLILPGFITTGLEVWEANRTCLKKLNINLSLRQWMLSAKMILLAMRDPTCWLELFGLDPHSGLDKPGIRVRGGEGAASVGEFVPGFWVWEKIIRNLADIGYDTNNFAVASYDWRLSPDLLHSRDGFFYRMKHLILQLYEEHQNRRIVVIGHSYANVVLVQFIRWAEEQEAGFVNTYVSDIINIGGPSLGTFKTLSATLFGDVRDTLDIPRVLRRVLDQVMDVNLRTNFSRTWSSLLAMLPHPCLNYEGGLLRNSDGLHSSTEEALQKLRLDCERGGHTLCQEKVALLLERGAKELPHLPKALNTTMYCLYGVNKPTEIGYQIRVVERVAQGSPSASPSPFDLSDKVVANNSSPNGGVIFAEGDGTIPLPSLAYMCRAPNGWKNSFRRVVTLEFPHNVSHAALLDFRGGRSSGDHVDILGNHATLEVILRIVSGVEVEANNQSSQEQHQKENNLMATESRADYPSVMEDRIFSNVDEVLSSKVVEKCRHL